MTSEVNLHANYILDDLADLDTPEMLNVILSLSIEADSAGPRQAPGVGLWVNLVRLTDQSIREFQLARAELLYCKEQDTPQFAAFFRAIDALEQSIVATHRAMIMAGRLIESRLGRGARRPPRVWKENVRLMRHAIEHTDDRITGDRQPHILAGMSAMLTPMATYAQLGSQRLFYRELSGCIRGCHRTVETMRR